MLQSPARAEMAGQLAVVCHNLLPARDCLQAARKLARAALSKARAAYIATKRGAKVCLARCATATSPTQPYTIQRQCVQVGSPTPPEK